MTGEQSPCISLEVLKPFEEISMPIVDLPEQPFLIQNSKKYTEKKVRLSIDFQEKRQMQRLLEQQVNKTSFLLLQRH